MFKTTDEIKFDELWDYLIDFEIATEEELCLAVALCGKSSGTLESVLFVRTGYRSLEQLRDEEY